MAFLTEQLFFVHAVPDSPRIASTTACFILLIGHTEPFIRCIQYADFRLPLPVPDSSIIFGSRYSALISSGFKPSKNFGNPCSSSSKKRTGRPHIFMETGLVCLYRYRISRLICCCQSVPASADVIGFRYVFKESVFHMTHASGNASVVA